MALKLITCSHETFTFKTRHFRVRMLLCCMNNLDLVPFLEVCVLRTYVISDNIE